MSDQHSHESRSAWPQFARIAVVGAALLLSWLYRDWLATKTFYGVHPVAVLVVIAGFRIFRSAISDLLRLRISADLAVAIAAIAALVIREEFAAAEVIFIMLVGGALEEFAVDRTERSIHRIIEMTPDTARVRRAGGEEIVPVAAVAVGDTVVVRPGERVPVDGTVAAGSSAVNEATITGEPLAAAKAPGDEVHAGTINETGAIAVEATRVGGDTTLARIAQLVKEARERKGQAEQRADRWAVWFVPLVLAAAAATYLITREPIRAVAVLVVACPCALVLATPTAIVAAIGRLAREGILVRGGAYLEALATADTVAFDKTGTVTRGEPVVVGGAGLGGRSLEEVLRYAAAVEQHSEHGLARVIVRYAAERGVLPAEASDFRAHPGAGAVATVEGRRVAVGKASFLRALSVAGMDEAEAAARDLEARGAMLAFCSLDDEVLGFIAAEDPPRPEAAEAVADLHEAGIQETILLTGDHDRAARTVRQAAGIGSHRADLPPEQKAQIIEHLQEAGRTVVAVGDGVNDAPALATADVGIAMGDVATDVTADAADVVLAAADLRRVPQLIRFSRRTMTTVMTNVLWFALLFNAIGVLLSAQGVIGPIGAAVYHQIASLLVVCNSLRLLAAGRLEERGRVARLRDRVGRLLADVYRRLRNFRWGPVAAWLTAHRRSITRWGPVALLLAYVASGIYAVGPRQVVIVRRFGAECGAARTPGLHYRVPWPVDKITRVQPWRVRSVEIGYRTLPGGEEAGGYDWENPHEAGAYEKVAAESLRLTGDENVLDVNVSLEYRIADPHQYLFHVADEAGLVRVVAESAVQKAIGAETVDNVLTDRRAGIEDSITAAADALFVQYESGIQVVDVRLLDIHPPVQVVPAFREVASALEEKRTAVEQAWAYSNEELPKARGRAAAMRLGAEAWSAARVLRAAGDAARFQRLEGAHRRWPQVMEIRLYLDAIERALAPHRKLILNRPGAGRRQVFLIDSEGVRLQGGATGTAAPALPPLPPEAQPSPETEAPSGMPPTPPQPATPAGDTSTTTAAPAETLPEVNRE